MEALDAQIVALRQEVLALKEQVTPLLRQSASTTPAFCAMHGSVFEGDSSRTVVPRLDLAVPEMAKLSRQVQGAFSKWDVPGSARLKSPECSPKVAGAGVSSASPAPRASLASTITRSSEESDIDATDESDLDARVSDLFEGRMHAQRDLHADLSTTCADVLEVKRSNALAKMEARLMKLDASQQALATDMDLKLTGELERITYEHMSGQLLTTTLAEKHQAKSGEALREAFEAFESKFMLEFSAMREDHDVQFEHLRSDMCGTEAVLSEQQSALSYLQSAHNRLRSDHAEAREVLDIKLSVELEGWVEQMTTASKDLQNSQERCESQCQKIVCDQLEIRQRLERSTTECKTSIKLLGDRLGQKLVDVENKAIAGFPRRCAEHRESHFKALESIIRQEFDSKFVRSDASMHAAVEALELKLLAEIDQRLGESNPARHSQDARIGFPDAGG